MVLMIPVALVSRSSSVCSIIRRKVLLLPLSFLSLVVVTALLHQILHIYFFYVVVVATLTE